MVDVHVPGLGNVPRGGLIAGVLVGVGGGLYLWYKHKENAASASTANTSPGATNAYGYGYGGYGYSNPAFNEPYIGGEYGYGGLYGYGIGQGYGVGTSEPSLVPVTTNAEWAQAAESYLVNTGGYASGTVAGALGAYISGATLSASQQSVVEAAIAFQGYPPQEGANGYPPAMHTSTATGQSGGGGSTTTSGTTVPGVAGQSANTALSIIRKAGFTATTSPFRNPLNTYTATSTKPAAGSSASKGSHVIVYVQVQKKGK
jgi:PASTA domain